MRRMLVLLAVAALAAYGLFEARQLITGPTITIVTPADGSATSSPAVRVEGVAHNISFLTINDAPAYTDEAGHFYEVLTPPPGLSVISVSATDRFGRAVKKTLTINVLTYCIKV